MKIRFYFYKVVSKIFNNKEILYNYYRKKGVNIGKKCLICSNPVTMEPNLVSIGDNVTISTNVTFITHDNSIKLIMPDKTDIFGKIIIGNNVFIGANSIIMYGVTIPNNVIIAAGSIITKSIKESNVVVSTGNRVLCTWEQFYNKNKDYAIRRQDLANSKEKLITK